MYSAGVWLQKPGIGLPDLFPRTHPVKKITDDADHLASECVHCRGSIRQESLGFFRDHGGAQAANHLPIPTYLISEELGAISFSLR